MLLVDDLRVLKAVLRFLCVYHHLLRSWFWSVWSGLATGTNIDRIRSVDYSTNYITAVVKILSLWSGRMVVALFNLSENTTDADMR